MPDHIHVIISLANANVSPVGATLAVVLDNKLVDANNKAMDGDLIGQPKEIVCSQGIGQPQVLPQQPTIGSIIGAYKSIVSNEALKIYKLKNQSMGKFWQRNYYEHIIRDYESYVHILNYIIDNPRRWDGTR